MTTTYEPEVINTYALPETIDTDATGSVNYEGKTVASPSTRVDKQFPVKNIARETLSESINTRTKRILGNYTFGALGAISIGSYENGVSGDIRITPDGLTARNINGVTTFFIDGVTGDATFLGTISAGSVVVGYAKGFVSTLVWTATDFNTANWAAGTIKTSDGISYSIASGNTGNISATTYIYLHPATSITVLQTSTTATDAAGDGKILTAIIELGTSGAGCIITVIGSTGTTIDGDRIVTGKIESADGLTYWDLDNNLFVQSDGTYPRVVIGDA